MICMACGQHIPRGEETGLRHLSPLCQPCYRDVAGRECEKHPHARYQSYTWGDEEQDCAEREEEGYDMGLHH